MDILFESYLEKIGILLSLAGVYLSIKQKKSAWIFNILASLVYGFVFFQIKLFADMELQLFFIMMGVFGYYQWSRDASDWQPEKSTLVSLGIGIICSIVFGVILGMLHKNITESVSYPFLDAILSGFSLYGTYLAAQKKIENWIVWIFVDLLYAFIYYQKGIQWTSALYLVFIGLAIKGFYDWKKKLL